MEGSQLLEVADGVDVQFKGQSNGFAVLFAVEVVNFLCSVECSEKFIPVQLGVACSACIREHTKRHTLITWKVVFLCVCMCVVCL